MQVFAPSVEMWAQRFHVVSMSLNEIDIDVPLLLAITVRLHEVQTPASSRTWIRMGQASPAFPPLILVDHIEHI